MLIKVKAAIELHEKYGISMITAKKALIRAEGGFYIACNIVEQYYRFLTTCIKFSPDFINQCSELTGLDLNEEIMRRAFIKADGNREKAIKMIINKGISFVCDPYQLPE